MSNSSLVNVNVQAYEGNYSLGRFGNKIEMITLHHMAGILTAEQCGNIFKQAGRQASAHYGIGSDGKIGQYVDEANTAWANSNWDANCKAVTIETSNCEIGGQWKVSDTVLNKLIDLIVDIAKRNNLGKLVKGQNLTWHQMYAATSCPGEYLLSKMDYIVSEANKKIEGKATSTQTTSNSYTVKVTTDALNIRAGAGTNYNITGCIRDKGIYTIVETKGNWGKLKSGKGWICLDYTQKTNATVSNRKSNEEIAREVIAGKWGNGADRKTKLANAGYDYNAVQAIVNKLI